MGVATTMAREISREIGSKTREFYEFVLPAVDIHMTAREITVVADVPGFAKDSIDVRLDGNALIIRARRERPDGEESSIVCAQRPLFIDKRVRLPADAADIAESVGSARCEDGVLTVTIPRERRGTSIPVQ